MRIVYDVSPLTHPRTGVGNYIRGALWGMAQANGGEHELVAFAPASFRGRGRLDAALDGIDAERRIVSLPFAHAIRRTWGFFRACFDHHSPCSHGMSQQYQQWSLACRIRPLESSGYVH